MVFGALIFEDHGVARVYPLTQAVTTLGRDPGNDVCLDDPTVSRFHARVVSGPDGSRIVDLGSGNGTKLDGIDLEPKVEKVLADGVQVSFGLVLVTYHRQMPGADELVAPLKSPAQATAPQPTGVAAEAPRVPVLVVTTARGAREVPLASSTMVVGRDPTVSDIVVESEAVSRRHARIDRRDWGWEITDLASTNGLLYQGRPIQNRPLTHGDIIGVGTSVTLEFRAPQAAAAPAAPGRPAGGREVSLDLPSRGPLVLGRSDNAGLTLSHPQVSRSHAQIVRAGEGFVLEDLGSAAGTYVNGQLVQRHVLAEGDVVRIGASRLVLEQGRLRVTDEEGNLRIDAFNLQRVVGKGLRILQDVSLSIYPREFVAIVGGSGAGKSTLLKALCGFNPADAGIVLLNGSDLYQNFDAYRYDLGYVPQDDIIHRELRVLNALDYAAKLRMPGDTTEQERRQRVMEVLRDLDLQSTVDRPVRALSGGQRKRVSIGVELLTRPSLFFLDEATSGLDPGTELQMMKLLRRLADQGRTVALVTHATKNVMICDKVIFMARGGNLAYYGPPEEALQYFGVSDFDEIYSRIETGDAKNWAVRFRASRQHMENVESRLGEVAASIAPYGAGGAPPAYGPQGSQAFAPPAAAQYQPAASDPWAAPASAPAAPGVPAGQVWQPPAPARPAPPRAAAGAPRQRVSTWRQFIVLCQRYLDTIWRDKKTSIMLFALAPVLGLLDFIIWDRDVLDLQVGNATRASLMLFMSCIVGILVGTITSVREIVKEDAVYRRERMVGLKVMPYIASKVLIGFVFALYSGVVLFLLKVAAVDFSHLPATSLFQLFLAIMLGTFAGVMWGLLVSAVAPSEDRAMLLVILVLVPQFMFSGAMVPLSDLGWVGKIVGSITSTRWQFGAMITSAQIESGPRLSPDFSDTYMPGIESMSNPIQKHALISSLHDQYGEIFHVNLTLYLGMMVAISFVLMAVITILQKRKDTL